MSVSLSSVSKKVCHFRLINKSPSYHPQRDLHEMRWNPSWTSSWIQCQCLVGLQKSEWTASRWIFARFGLPSYLQPLLNIKTWDDLCRHGSKNVGLLFARKHRTLPSAADFSLEGAVFWAPFFCRPPKIQEWYYATISFRSASVPLPGVFAGAEDEVSSAAAFGVDLPLRIAGWLGVAVFDRRSCLSSVLSMLSIKTSYAKAADMYVCVQIVFTYACLQSRPLLPETFCWYNPSSRL